MSSWPLRCAKRRYVNGKLQLHELERAVEIIEEVEREDSSRNGIPQWIVGGNIPPHYP
jgi:hypothetical protein